MIDFLTDFPLHFYAGNVVGSDCWKTEKSKTA